MSFERIVDDISKILLDANLSEITQAPQDVLPSGNFNYKGKVVKALTVIQRGAKIFIFRNTKDNKYYALSEGIVEPVTTSRTTLSRSTRPLKRPLGKTEAFGNYAILYSVDSETKIDFWIAGRDYEAKVYTLQKERVPPQPIAQYPPGFYLVVWASNLYPTQSGDAYSDVIQVRNETDYQTPVPLPGSGNLDSLFRQGGRYYIPRPDGFGSFNFGGSFLIPSITMYFNMWTGSPVEYTFEGSGSQRRAVYDIPGDAVFRTSIAFVFGGQGFSAAEGQQANIWEYTGVSGVTPNEFSGLSGGWEVPETILGKGFSKEELRRANNHSPYGGIYAPVYDFGTPANQASFIITFALIPWDQEPGPAYPGSNRLSISRGPNGDNPIQNFGDGIFPDDNPPIIYDGRSAFEPSPTKPQPSTYKLGTYETYLSTRNNSPVFFLKTDDRRERLGGNPPPSAGPTYDTYVYRELISKTAVKNMTRANIDNAQVGSDATLFTKVIRFGFKDWKGYLQSLADNFESVRSPVQGTNAFGSFDIFSTKFVGRNQLVAQNVLNNGYYIDENFFIVLPSSTIEAFLGDPEAESTEVFEASMTQYVSPLTETGGYYEYDPSVLQFGESVILEIEVSKPKKLTNFLASRPDDVRIIDIVPLLTSSIKKNAANLSDEPGEIEELPPDDEP